MNYGEPIHIRPADEDEVPLSPDERRVAIREGFQDVDIPRWHPAIAQNFSLMSARLHRKVAAA